MFDTEMLSTAAVLNLEVNAEGVPFDCSRVQAEAGRMVDKLKQKLG